MNLLRVMSAVLLATCWAAAAFAAPPLLTGNAVSIRVVGDWGAVDRQDIEAVLRSVADALTPDGARALPTIVVTPTQDAPVVLYGHGEAGEYRVQLHARDANWNLYVYEFAHEYCHIASNYDSQLAGGVRRNQWFEESLCETASLYALKSLAQSWQLAPPTPRAVTGSRQLRWFYDLLMAEDHRRVPAAGFAAWLHENENELRQDPYRRRLNEVVAVRLLPLFQDRASWQALPSLNLDPRDGDCDLDSYLDHWYRNSPAGQKSIVAGIRAALRRDTQASVALAAPR